MRKLLVSLASLVIGLSSLTGCAVNDATVDTNSGAAYRAYSFPLKNGLQYSYMRFSSNTGFLDARYDTALYQIILGTPQSPANTLTHVSGGVNAPNVLFYYTVGIESKKDCQSTIWNDNSKFVALAGDLIDGSTWLADTTHGITATVTAHYASYMLPGRETSFNDVIAVKYAPAANPMDYYIRYYAKEVGLILERHFIGDNAEISNLQLLKVQTPSPVSRISLPGPSNMSVSGPIRAVFTGSPEIMK